MCADYDEEYDGFEEEEDAAFFDELFTEYSKHYQFNEQTRRNMARALTELNYKTDLVFKRAMKGEYGKFIKKKKGWVPEAEVIVLPPMIYPPPEPEPEIVIPAPKIKKVIYTQKRSDVVYSKHYVTVPVLLQHRSCGRCAFNLPKDTKQRILLESTESSSDAITLPCGVKYSITENEQTVITTVFGYPLVVSDGCETNSSQVVPRRWDVSSPCRFVLLFPNFGIVISGFLCVDDQLANAVVNSLTVGDKKVSFVYPGTVCQIEFREHSHKHRVYWDCEHPVRTSKQFLGKIRTSTEEIDGILFVWSMGTPIKAKMIRPSFEKEENDLVGKVTIELVEEIPLDFTVSTRELNQFQLCCGQQIVGSGTVISIPQKEC